jgi:hypothetical protein
MGCTPSMGNRLVETRSPATRTGSASPVRLTLFVCIAAMWENDRLKSR